MIMVESGRFEDMKTMVERWMTLMVIESCDDVERQLRYCKRI